MKKSGKIVSSASFTRAPYPPLTRSPFPNGEGCETRMPLFSRQRLSRVEKTKRRRLRRRKRKPTPPRCARQPLPREGARVDTPSFLWKEVPQRGRGWMGEAGFPYHSLPRVGKVASGASRIGFWRDEKEREDRLKCVVYESTLSTADAVPLPQWGRLRNENTALSLTLLV